MSFGTHLYNLRGSELLKSWLISCELPQTSFGYSSRDRVSIFGGCGISNHFGLWRWGQRIETEIASVKFEPLISGLGSTLTTTPFYCIVDATANEL